MSKLFGTSRRALLAILSGASMSGLSRASGRTPDPQNVGESDPVSWWSRQAGFLQRGKGAILRPITAKLRETVSIKDFGAFGDGHSQDSAAFTAAAAALDGGGCLEIPSGIYRVGEQVYGPARGNVHAYDFASIGSDEVIVNGDLTDRTIGNWMLVNFAAGSQGIVHEAGTSASAKQIIKVLPYTTYLVTITQNTHARGGFALFIGNVPVFTEGDYLQTEMGANTYQFAMFSYAAEGPTSFELRSDVQWGGSISQISIVKVEREAPYDFFGMSADKRDFTNCFGIKFGRFLSGNIGIGDRLTSALFSERAAWNIAIGSRALSSNVDGFENTAIGSFALEYNQSDRNTAGGYSAFRYNTKGDRNTGWGYKTFGRNSVGSNNTGVGFWASMYNQTGSNNSSFGSLAGYYNAHGSFNAAFGAQAGLQNDGGVGNTYVGAIAGPYTPGSATFSYSHSTCIGSESKAYGDRTTAVGARARCGSDPYSGGQAVGSTAAAFGYNAVAARDNSVAVGSEASTHELRGTAVGDTAKAAGADGTAIGYLASAAENSTSIGSRAGANLIGAGNLSIGHQANQFTTQTRLSNSTAIGAGAKCTANDQVTIGNINVNVIRAAVATITSPSDRRDKKNIGYIDGTFASDFIRSMKPAKWEWDMRAPASRKGCGAGFIAQELLEAQEAHAADWLRLVDDSDPERLETAPGLLIPILVAALKNTLERIDKLEGKCSRCAGGV